MSSNIPVPSGKKPETAGGFRSRIQPPSTLKKPLFQFRNSALSTAKITRHPSALKRPADSAASFQHPFKRTTPLSLMRSSSSVNRPIVQPTTQSAIARLEFNDHQNELSAIFNSNSGATSISNFSSSVQKESRATSPIVNWQLQDTQLSAFKSKISILEKQLNEMIAKNSRSKIENEIKETKIKSELEASQRMVSDLKKELAASSEQREKIKAELEQFQNEHLKQSEAFDTTQLEYEKTISELKNEILELKSSEAEAKTALASETVKLKFRVDELENLLEKSNAEKHVYLSSFNELSSKDFNVERLKEDLNSANQEVALLKEQVESLQENARLNDMLKGEINHYQQVQEENSHLKNKLNMLSDVHTKNLVLKEQVENLKAQLANQNELIRQKNVDLGELTFNKKRINEWIQIVGADTPDIVVSQLNEMKQMLDMIRMENESLKADLKDKTSNESMVSNFSKANELQMSQLNQEISQLKANFKRLNRKCLLIEKQRDSYKNVIDSYESEVTIDFDNVQRKRASELEAALNEQKELMAIYENDLKIANEVAAKLMAKEREVHELTSEIERIKMLNPHVCTTNITLDVSTLQTREKNFRVIHLKENPISVKINEYNEEFNRLSEENARLKCLVEVLESGDVADMTRQINDGLQSRTEVEKWKKKFDSLEKRHSGLKDSFKKISKSFRETCLYLTGYRIDAIASNRYKLTHAYDREKRKLIFEVNKSEITLLEESSQLESLRDKIQTYLTEGQSYPAFLAAFSLYLFNESSSLSRSMLWT